jgi:hypothetical protein
MIIPNFNGSNCVLHFVLGTLYICLCFDNECWFIVVVRLMPFIIDSIVWLNDKDRIPVSIRIIVIGVRTVRYSTQKHRCRYPLLRIVP